MGGEGNSGNGDRRHYSENASGARNQHAIEIPTARAAHQWNSWAAPGT
jgi:hypothetical protein